MTSRTTTIVVTVAVLAGAAVAGVGLATRGTSKPARVLQVDEQRGIVGRVVLGETRDNVVGVLGPPSSAESSGPALRYPHLVVTLGAGHVRSIETDDPAARTDRAVHVGDPFSAARASYGKAAKCNPDSPDKQAPHPICRVKVASGSMVIRGDPIRSITLVRTS